jgi:Fuc2NAc and GlcNAc transferase
MVYFKFIVLLFFIAFVSSMLTHSIRILSLKYKIFDIPNNRSSHDVPTPKGGGVSIVVLLMMTIMVLSFYDLIDKDILMSLSIGLIIVSIIGLIDDYKNLPILIRAIGYIVAIMISLKYIGELTSVEVNNNSLYLGYSGYIFSVLFVFWLTNLYNFMDGTDGFAGIQTICVSMFIGVILYLSGHMSLAIILFCVASSTIGFLYWNWAPAKIFMGDVGSCTLGFLFGLLAIYMEKNGIISIVVWIILLAPFIGDATFTLFKRIINREKWYEAHNSHAYQKLYQLGISHSKLAIGLLITNVFIIWPFAYFAHSYKNIEFMMLISSYCIFSIIWLIVQNKYKEFEITTF